MQFGPLTSALLTCIVGGASLFGQTIDLGSAPVDTFCTGGSVFVIPIPGTVGDLTLRYGTYKCVVPTLPGFQDVTLVMRETGTVSASGQRKFSVSINGQPVLVDYDLFATAGLSEVQRTFTVWSAGYVAIDFTYKLKSAIASSIKVAPAKPTNPIVEPGFGIVSELDSSLAQTQKIGINTSVTMHRVPVPVVGGACNLAGQFAVDADAQYFCIQDTPIVPNSVPWGHWVAFPRIRSGDGIVVSSVGQLAIDTSYLNTIYAQLNAHNTFIGKQTFVPSSTTAGVRIVCGSIPTAMTPNDLFCTPGSIMGFWNGTIHQFLVTTNTIP